MNRGDMRTVLRERVKDAKKTEWTDAYLDGELNLAAQHVSLRLGEMSEIGFGRRAYSIAAGQTSSEIILWGLTDYHSPIALYPADVNPSVTPRWVTEASTNRRSKYRPDGCDEDGNHLYRVKYMPTDTLRLTLTGGAGSDSFRLSVGGQMTGTIVWNASAAAVQTALAALSTIGSGNVIVTKPSASTSQWIIQYAGALRDVGMPMMVSSNLTGAITAALVELGRYAVVFLASQPPSVALLFIYNVRVPEIPTGAAHDTKFFTVAPEQYHEQIIEHAAAVILAHDGSSTASFAASFDEALGMLMLRTSRAKNDPAKVRT